tara:strand:- start:1 stop:144 length:144 start_codon:yes stop_codon:yes gene_type:complete
MHPALQQMQTFLRAQRLHLVFALFSKLLTINSIPIQLLVFETTTTQI